MLQALSLIQRLKKKAESKRGRRHDPSLISSMYVGMCKFLGGYISRDEFLNMDALYVAEVQSVMSKTIEEQERSQNKMKAEMEKAKGCR